jgi:nicotinate-nucleotide adenylyltransferase
LAQEALTDLPLRQIRFIPAGQPPHRAAPQVPAAARLDMVRLACADNPNFVVDEREVLRAAPSYTVATLTALRAEVGPDQALCLLLGADAYLDLQSWHRWQELFQLAHLVVAHRPGFPQTAWAEHMSPALAQAHAARYTEHPHDLENAPAGRIYALAITALDISASRIRADLQRGASPRYLLPDAVLNYISTRKLYTE